MEGSERRHVRPGMEGVGGGRGRAPSVCSLHPRSAPSVRADRLPGLSLPGVVPVSMSCHRLSTGQQTITPFLLGFDSSRPDDPNRPPDQPTPGSTTSPTQESRSSSDPSPDLSRSSSARSARRSSSFLPSFRLAGFSSDRDRRDSDRRNRDMRSSRSGKDSQPKPKPKPLLVLRLSSSSFLDTIIRDDKTKDPLYILETSSENTSIYRLDHIRDEPIKAATVQWPLHPVRVKGKSGRSIQFGNGSWREAEDVLKNGPLGNTAYADRTTPDLLLR